MNLVIPCGGRKMSHIHDLYTYINVHRQTDRNGGHIASILSHEYDTHSNIKLTGLYKIIGAHLCTPLYF